MLLSLHGQLLTLPDNTVVYPGHGTNSTIGAERLGNPYLRIR
jgi:glyoxylase-like metal-dependent hydrolase (beta-lactamase superfamily II)